jgi:hypothetical protein
VDVVRAIASVVDVPMEVLLIVREPRALLRSYHAQMVAQGSDLRFSGLLAHLLLRPDAWMARVLDPTSWVDTLPASAVRIVPFERLFADVACSRDLFAWLEASDAHHRFLTLHKNPRITDAQLRDLLASPRQPGERGAGWRRTFSDQEVADGAARAGVEPERLVAAMTPAGVGGGADDPLQPDPVLWAAVERHLRACNSRLARRLPEHDWAGMGYQLEAPDTV